VAGGRSGTARHDTLVAELAAGDLKPVCEPLNGDWPNGRSLPPSTGCRAVVEIW
jgi:hypothetical protein